MVKVGSNVLNKLCLTNYFYLDFTLIFIALLVDYFTIKHNCTITLFWGRTPSSSFE